MGRVIKYATAPLLGGLGLMKCNSSAVAGVRVIGVIPWGSGRKTLI